MIDRPTTDRLISTVLRHDGTFSVVVRGYWTGVEIGAYDGFSTKDEAAEMIGKMVTDHLKSAENFVTVSLSF